MERAQRHIRIEMSRAEPEHRSRGVLWSWWFWALIVAFIVWSSGWGWGPGWGGWWFWNGGQTTAQLRIERQHEPPLQQRQEKQQELHW
jgi:hypothetical protein